jgi:hypothetical protein
LELFLGRAAIPGHGLFHLGRSVFYHFNALFRSREHGAGARFPDPFDRANVLGKKKRLKRHDIGVITLNIFLEGFKNMKKTLGNRILGGGTNGPADHEFVIPPVARFEDPKSGPVGAWINA